MCISCLALLLSSAVSLPMSLSMQCFTWCLPGACSTQWWQQLGWLKSPHRHMSPASHGGIPSPQQPPNLKLLKQLESPPQRPLQGEDRPWHQGWNRLCEADGHGQQKTGVQRVSPGSAHFSGSVPHTFFLGEMDESPWSKSCADLGQCSLPFCRAEVKSQGRCNQAGTSRC